MDKRAMALAQGLAYVWGRRDAGESKVEDWEFARAWMEVSERDNGPSITTAYEQFRDKGKID